MRTLIVIYVVLCLWFLLALCKAAGDADEAMGCK